MQSLNIDKYSIITFSCLYNLVFHNYTIENTMLLRVIFIKDLGILHDSNTFFSLHIN